MRSRKVIAMMVVGLVAILPAASGVITSPPTAADDPPCIKFEDLPLGTEYHVDDTFADSGAVIDVQIFQLSDGRWYDDGRTRVGNRTYAGGSGQEMEVLNVNLDFNFGGPCEALSLLFGEYGGNLNIKINGDFENFNDFIDINKRTIGGVNVAVSDFGDDKGSLTLSGTINSFAVGGQELVIDNVCPTVPAVEMPDLIITGVQCDREKDRIGYSIKNTGEATASAGHYAGLWVDGKKACADHVEVDLKPGTSYAGWFDCYTWPECQTIEVKVCADKDNTVEESNEENNCLEGICECAPAEKPDLIITDVWSEDSIICYQIRNIGGGAAPTGHYTGLLIDGVHEISDYVAVDLAPGESLKRCFDYDWVCTPPEDTIKVCTDYKDDVTESDETNNCRKEGWKCDVTPPKIVEGPGVSKITTSSAVVSWDTDEDADSIVNYGRVAGKYDLEKKDSALVKNHEITLTGLKPSAVYHLVVQSTDSSGNSATSKDIAFETSASPDSEDPVISIVDPGICTGITRIAAVASDNIGVEKVEFCLEGKLIYTDYSSSSPDYRFFLDTLPYRNGEYRLEAKAFDRHGNVDIDREDIQIYNPIPDLVPPSVSITYPSEGDTVSGTITVEVETSDDVSVDRVKFYIDDDYRWWDDTPPYTFNWNTQTVENGEHTITATAYDSSSNFASDSITVIVEEPPPPQPVIVVTRGEVLRHGLVGFSVFLWVENTGDGAASNIEIVDRVRGFQATSSIGNPSYDAASKECELHLTIPELLPHSRESLGYIIYPILFEIPEPPAHDWPVPEPFLNYRIGTYTHLSYQGPDGEMYEEDLSIPATRVVEYTGDFRLVGEGTLEGVGEADYVIVTNPSKLFALPEYVDDDVNTLLSTMASLAAWRGGVLGYLDTYDTDTLDRMVEPPETCYYYPPLPPVADSWTPYLAPGFSRGDGYLLIVGETDIVPSFSIWDTDIRDATNRWTGGPVYPVPLVDNVYADTSGNQLPDLAVGRIIGNNAQALTNTIQNSLLHAFECTDAFVVSGLGSDSFERNAEDVADILDDEFAVDLMHASSYPGPAATLVQFRNRAEDKDIIYFRDHGALWEWSSIVRTWDFPVDFGESYPFAFAMACWTGNYELGRIAEEFLECNTTVYIGATEKSPRSVNNEAGKKFFTDWVSRHSCDEPLGQVLKNTKRELGVSDDYKRLWVLEYNLYGDPKCRFTTPRAAALAQKAPAEPLSSLDVVIPDYEVTTREGLDYVEIPGGDLLLEEGKPQLPYYSVSIDYPEGHKVQDVVLTDRSGLVTAIGLSLPTVSMAPGGDGTQQPEEMAEIASLGWYPEEEYRWQILENPDSTTTLVIKMYPFYYNPLTTDVRFYKNYSFDIDYTISPVAINSLTTDKDAYRQGDTVMIDIGLNSTAESQDVIVSALVKRYSTGDIVDGLLLHNLKGLTGPASFSPQWESSGFEPGYYNVEATLKDTNGNVLDRRTEMFRLGICSGEITGFTATPEYFDIGDNIDLSLTFNNVGTVAITGTAVIRVQDEVGETVHEFSHDVTDLAPSASVSFDDTWDTSGAEEGGYQIVASVLYDSQAAGPATIAVSTSHPPNTPSSPSPANHATGVSINTGLSWSGGDPDAGDMVTYDVYFGTSTTPPLRETIGPYTATQSPITYDPGMLVDGAKYYWKIVATDSHGVTREGPVWEFTVGQPGATVTWDLPWGLDADPASVNIYTYPGDAVAVTLADVDLSMPSGLLIWHYGGAGLGWRFYKKGWGAVNTLETLTPGEGYIAIVPTAGVWEIPQG